MKIKKLFCFVLALCMVLMLTPVTTDAQEGLFTSDVGYSPGLYDSEAEQPAGTSWDRNSKFVGVTSNPNIAPVITSISPNSGVIKGGNLVSVEGENFVSDTKVEIGGVQAPTTFHNSKKIMVRIPAGNSVGMVDVTVINPDGQAAVLSKGYTYELPVPNPDPAPVITSITPNSGVVTGGNLVSVEGENFVSDTKVEIGGVQAPTTLYSSKKIMVRIPAAKSVGMVDVTVINPDGQVAVLSKGYTYELPVPNPDPAPVITSITPNSGVVTGGNLVSVEGENFVSDTKVEIGGVQALTTLYSSKKIMVRIPAGNSVGMVDVTVINPDGQAAVLSKGYTYELPVHVPDPAPIITSITPNSGVVTGGNLVSVEGENFVSATKVEIGGVQAPTTLYNSKKIMVRIPAAKSVGMVDVTVINPDGQVAVLSNGYTYELPVPNPDPAPVIMSITPNSGVVTGGNLVSVEGENFVSDTKIEIGGVQAPTTFHNSKKIIVRIPAGKSAGMVDVTVINPDGQAAVLSKGYTYELPAPDPAPVITSITPNSGVVTGGNLVSVEGENFVSATKVEIGGVQAPTTLYNSKKIMVRIPAGNSVGMVDVTVINPDGQAAVLSKGYTYELPVPNPDPAPVITSITPNSGVVTGGNLVSVEGENFVSATKVEIGGVQAPTTLYNSKKIMVRIPAGNSVGMVDVTVINPDGQAAVLSKGYTYELPAPDPAPIITSINPNRGALTGGNLVTIEGEHFVSATKVEIGGVQAPTTFYGDKKLIVRIPAGKSGGMVDVTIINPDGQVAVLSKGYTYELPAPVITSISPNSGVLTGGNLVTIEGGNFVSDTKVEIGGVQAPSTFHNSGEILVRIPAGKSAGMVDVTIINPDGQVAVLSNGYTYELPAPDPAPIITSINPNSGVIKGGNLVSVEGENFVSATKVEIGGIQALTTLYSSKKIMVRIPAGNSVGMVDVTVINPDGQVAVLSKGYTYELPAPDPAPIITSINPNSGVIKGGNLVTVEGENFVSDTKVEIGGVQALTTLYSSKKIMVRIPAANSAGMVDVTVINPDGQVAVLSNGYTYN